MTAPSASELSELEAGFAAKPSTSASGVMPPIAQVAAESAALAHVMPTEDREAAALTSADAARFREAEAEGRLVQAIPTVEIVADEIMRDRLTLGVEEMAELKTSLSLNGLRLPIEVFELSETDPEGRRYGLLSGYRRLAAVRALEAETGGAEWSTISAFIREPGSVSKAYLSMVEENEIRADLTPYERGRIAVIAAGQGAFPSVEAAVNGLFYAASKAKRSKIRSFALVHEELGDLLTFPEDLSERAGLRLAGALRAGFAAKLREALATGLGTDANGEWALLEPIAVEVEVENKPSKRGGRPRKSTGPDRGSGGLRRLDTGITLRRTSDPKGHIIRVEGHGVDEEIMERALDQLEQFLGP